MHIFNNNRKLIWNTKNSLKCCELERRQKAEKGENDTLKSN